MISARRVLLPLTIAALAFTAAACGVDAGDQAANSTATTAPSSDTTATFGDPDTSTTEPESTDTTTPKDLTELEQQQLDSMVGAYEAMGLESKDAECLANGMLGLIGEGGEVTDAPNVMDIINECDISMDELSELGGGDLAGGSVEDGMRYGLESSLKSAGLSDEQASCMADAFIEEYGTDASAASDPAKLEKLMAGCDVDPSDLNGG